MHSKFIRRAARAAGSLVSGAWAGAVVVLVCACSGGRTEHDSGDSEPDIDPDTATDVVDGSDDPEADGPDGADADDGADPDSTVEWTWYDGPVPDVPVFTKQDHVASCMRSRACSTSNPQQLGTCTAAYANITGRMIGITLGAVARCVALAEPTCEAVVDCLTGGEGPTACVPLETPDRCDGSVLRQCSRVSAVDLVFDCALLAMQCHIMDDGTATCGLGSCDSSTFRSDCHGDTLVVCEGGVVTMALCGAAGLECVQEPGEPGRCAGGGDPCSETTDPRRCDADFIVGCIDGTTASVDCDMVVPRWTCGIRGGVPGCIPSGDECVAEPLLGSDLDESCSGESVTFCMDGWVTTLPCAGYGMGPCTDLGEAARCTPP